MLKYLSSTPAFMLLAATLTLVSVGCSVNKQADALRDRESPANTAPTPASLITESAQPTIPPPPAPAPSTPAQNLEMALDKATSANSISQSALSAEDWNLAVNQWQGAIALLKKIPKTNSNYPVAQTKISEFQANVTKAKQQASRPVRVQPEPTAPIVVVPVTPRPAPKQRAITVPSTVTAAAPAPAKPSAPPAAVNVPATPAKEVFQTPIKRRAGGIPVIDVTFNGGQAFEMIVDTGASGTVITEQMAQVLGVQPVAKAKANTASAKGIIFPLGYVDSIQVGELAVRNVRVAIAGPELDTGLLGHDFFGEYDITIKRDVVEFHHR